MISILFANLDENAKLPGNYNNSKMITKFVKLVGTIYNVSNGVTSSWSTDVEKGGRPGPDDWLKACRFVHQQTRCHVLAVSHQKRHQIEGSEMKISDFDFQPINGNKVLQNRSEIL